VRHERRSDPAAAAGAAGEAVSGPTLCCVCGGRIRREEAATYRFDHDTKTKTVRHAACVPTREKEDCMTTYVILAADRNDPRRLNIAGEVDAPGTVTAIRSYLENGGSPIAEGEQASFYAVPKRSFSEVTVGVARPEPKVTYAQADRPARVRRRGKAVEPQPETEADPAEGAQAAAV
jgi:hypothetical protein